MDFDIIVPVLYSYSKKFGVTGETLGLFTATFSIAQFFAAPVLRSLSDKWGRKPLLVFTLAGTCISILIFCVGAKFTPAFCCQDIRCLNRR